MSTSMTLLSLLEPSPAHGYTLKRQYDDRHARRRPLAFGQVYASLARFDRDGWAEVSDIEAGEGPERKLYRITARGVEKIDRWVYERQRTDEFASSELFSRLAVALLSGRAADRVLDGQRQVHLDRMRELQRARRGASSFEMLAITYESAHLDADLRWIDDSIARLDALTADMSGGGA